eukprot:9466623-Pyramimonas_sp.AAC.1
MRHLHPLRHTPHTFRHLIRCFTDDPSAAAHLRPPHPCRHTTREVGGPRNRPTEGSNSAARYATDTLFCTPLTRFVAPWRAPAKAPVLPAACVPHTHVATTLTEGMAP